MSTISSTKIIRSNRRTLSLHINEDLTLTVKAPLFILPGDIQRFIDKNSEWIKKRTEQLQQRKVVKENRYEHGGELLFLGKSYIFTVGNYPAVKIEGDRFLFPQFLMFRVEKEITNWYIQQAKNIVISQLALYAKEMNVSYKSVTFSDTKSKWGSCTYDNRLQFCWRLVMAPVLVVNYVIVHELAHTLEKNHSTRFWSKVRLYNPSYKQQIKWLKQHGDGLV
jgi:predicted metal-dependent hydrolase